MSKPENGTYDVIIIGAGISGLVCGCYLAKAGMKVLILEQHDKPGGYCTSFKRQGFTFDAAAHTLGGYREGANFRQIITELGIDKIVKITRYDPSDIVVAPDFKITFWNDTEKTINELIKIFPKEKENIHNYYTYYRNLESASQFENAKLKDKTFGSFLRSYFSDNTLISAISYPTLGYGGLPPSLLHAFTGTKIFNEYINDGGYYLEGGMQALPDAFARVIQQNNGTLLYRRLVKSITCKNKIATGAELSNNESYASKYVVSACDITQTFKTFLGEDIVDKRLLDKLNNFIPSISSFILYIGIDKPFEELPSPGTNIWHLPGYDPDSIFDSMTHADYPFSDSYMFRVSPDRKTIMAIWFSPFKESIFWKQNKKKIADELLSRLEKYIPNLREHIAYFDAATPYTLYRYTLNYQGANYGWAPLQSQLFEPDFRQKSFIKGLYITGHWTAQTYGVRGVAHLGYDTAKLILKQEQKHQHFR
jgi:phytoene dehydrogenase-like protein